ncbi:MAG: kynureninase [Candidatus Promineofilum sp.]|nr:kynureninase [Promineifilum sp.]
MAAWPTTLADARALDAADPLSAFRERFVSADPALIYLDGNSLGRLPRATAGRLATVVEEEWGERLVRGWGEGWFEAPQRIGGKLAGLLGAAADEVVLADSTSVNLFKLALAALLAQPERQVIVTDDLNFPSDLYVLESAARLAGASVRVVPSADGIHGPVEALVAALDGDTALLSLSHTVFKSGYTYDMSALTAAAHHAGALALWDLSHSAGAVAVDLNGAAADLAVGCTYKYLNGGPGAPAFLYVRRDRQEQLANPISGWIGRRDPFDFALDYAPAPGIARFLTGTPPILSLSAVEPGVEMLLEAGMERLRERSVRLSEYLIGRWQERLEPLGFRLNSPRDPARRGSHVSLGHPEGLRVNLALIHDQHVLPDFRRPDNIRLGIAPLYNTFADLYTAVERLRAVVVERLYERYDESGLTVT